MDTRELTALDQGIEALQDQISELTASAAQAREEGGEQVRARIAAIRADMAAQRQQARDEAAQAGDRARSQWQQFSADAAARMRGIQDGMERRRDEHDVERAKTEAEAAEDDALAALDFASWAIEHAEVAVLDAIDARTWADSRAAGSQTS
jgi:chromosome segregation ATPase